MTQMRAVYFVSQDDTETRKRQPKYSKNPTRFDCSAPIVAELKWQKEGKQNDASVGQKNVTIQEPDVLQ